MSSEAIEPRPWAAGYDSSEELYVTERLGSVTRGENVIGDYLHAIAKIPLLNAEQEVELAKDIEAGLLAQAIYDVRQAEDREEALETLQDTVFRASVTRLQPGPSKKQKHISPALRAAAETEATNFVMTVRKLADNPEVVADAELQALSAKGKAATARFSEANLRLAFSQAKQYRGKGVLLEDLVQEANAGLMHAVEKFDYQRGYKFSTYATGWLRNYLERAVNEQPRIIQLPKNTVEQLNAIKKVQRDLVHQLNREPTHEEMAKDAGLKPEQVTELLRYDQRVRSFEEPVGGDSVKPQRLIDTLENQAVVEAEDPVRAAEGEAARQTIRRALTQHLSERDMQVVKLRYGLDGGVPMSLRDISKVVDVSGERVRQIDSKVLRILRSSVFEGSLRSFLEEG